MQESIAVVGFACRFPGAPDADAFWRNLVDGKETLTRFTDHELARRGVPAGLRRNPSYVPVGGLLDDHDRFDPAPFGLSSVEAELLDPQQRVFLECAWHALEHAGRIGSEDVTGVFAGAALSAYLMTNLGHRFDPLGGADPAGNLGLHTANVADYLPLRTAHRLGLTGPAVSVGATCATSLVAVHVAAQALLAGECDTALAGGTSLRVPQGLGYLHVPDGPFSSDGHTRPYSADARGTVFTQGAGVVVLRRLSDALADGDHVHAVVLGSAVGSDGADRAGFTAPSPEGQARTIAEALAVAGVDPGSVSYVEGHGTGTVLGDPIEVRALRRVFGDADRPWCGLGSVKGNIGHADSAAGIAGLIKVVQSLRHRVLPASLHSSPANPELGLEGSAFRLVERSERWDAGLRRAGVSSFGMGGANCHVVLEEAPSAPPIDPDERAQLVVVSAATARACRDTASSLASSAPLEDMAYTLATGRREMTHRIAVAVESKADPAEALRRATVTEAAGTPPRIVFAFPGGGAQFAGMASSLYHDEPEFAGVVDDIAEFLLPLIGSDVRTVLLDPAATADARSPRIGLPALFTASVATTELLATWGVRPDVVLGHSVGEYAAAVAAGALSWQDAARLVAARSKLMETLPRGAMLSVPLGEDDVRALLAEYPDLDVAAINAADSCALSGPVSVITELRETLAAQGVQAHVVGVDVAAHSRLVEPAMPLLSEVARGLVTHPTTVDLVTTVTGQVASEADLADPERWVRHLRATVRFADALDTALGHEDAVLVQCGPGGMIASLAARRQSVRAAVTTFARADENVDGRAAMLESVGTLWAHGVPVDLAATHTGRRARVPLPGYAFERERYWVEPRTTRSVLVGPETVEPDATEPLQLPSWRRLTPLVANPGRRWAVVGDGPWAEALRDLVGEVDEAEAVIAVHHGTSLHEAVLGYGRFGGKPLVQLTVRGERVLGDEVVDPVATGVRGLPRVLAQEVPGLRWRTLDVAVDRPDAAALAAVLAETADLVDNDGNNAWEMALRNGERWVRHWEPWQPAPVPALPDDAVVVITGGTGGVGRAVAEELRGRAHVVLASRSGTPSVDVTDAEQLRDLLADVTARHGRIDVVIHAPVLVELAALSEMDERVARDTLAPKESGAVNLRAAIESLAEDVRPRAVVLMSSAAGTIGGFGLGAYVAASRFLDGFATGDPAWVAVDWDRWRFGTALEREAAAEITMRHALDAPDAVRVLLRVCALALAGVAPRQIAVSPAELNTRSLAIAQREIRGASGGAGLSTPAERLVAEVLGEALGRPVTSRDDDFFALGGHSLLATRVLASLRDHHGVELRLRDLLTRPTVAGLAELIGTAEASAERVAPATTESRPSSEPFPLTRVQHAYWLGRSSAFALGEVGCHFYLEHDCAELDVQRYQTAWNKLIARHEMLRSVITADGRNLVLPEVPTYVVPVHEPRDEAEFEALRDRLSHRVADPGRWPLIEVHAVRLPQGGHRVLVSVDVLVCDSASYLILDRELRALYENPEAELPAIGTTFAECVQGLHAERDDRAADYWSRRLDDLPPAPALPVRAADGPPRFGRRAARLAAPLWDTLRATAAKLGATPTAVLLTAYSDVLAHWSQTDHFSLTLTVFDRPEVHPDVTKVVGEFSSLLLFESDRRGLAAFTDRVRAAQERLFDDLDHRAFSGLEVLAEQARRTGQQRNVPVVFTGMLGLDRLGGEPHDHEWLGPVGFGVSQTPQVWLDHQAYEHRGDLVLQWDVAETSLDAEQADAAFAAYVAWLTELAGTPETWSDVSAGPVLEKPEGLLDELRGIWAELLGLDPDAVPADVSFLGLGGDSLLVVRMASVIRQRLDVVLALTDIRAELTLAELVELVTSLEGQGVRRRALDITVNRRLDPAAPFGLLPLQQAYFVGQQGEWELSYSSAHVCTDVALSDVDAERAPAALADALRRVIAHQPALRLRVSPDGTQRVLSADDPSTSVVPQVLDLREATAEVAAAEVARVRREMSTSGPDPVTGPPVEMRLTLLPGGAARLHTAFSLLAVDGWSAGVFDRELLTYLAEPNAVLPPLMIDFGDYVTSLHNARAGESWQADQRWWTDRLAQLPQAPALPMRAEPDAVDVSSMAARETRLSTGDWESLRERCAAHEVTPTAAVLTVYAIVLARLAGERRFLLNSLQANRLPLHPDVDRMMGAFSSTALLSIDLPASGRFADLAAAVRAEMADSLAHNLVSGVEVSRELARLRGSRRPVAPVVFQSTLGLDAALGGERPFFAGALGQVDISDYVQHIRTPQVHLELRVFELRGELVLNVAVVEELFGADVVDRLFTEVVSMVRELAAGLGWQDVIELPTRETAVATAPRSALPVDSGPARDDLERRITTLWADLLGLSQVDRSADFFALGGDSLLAVRMLGRLSREHGLSAPPRTFLAAPTPAGLAEALRERDIAVPLRDGDGPPLFLLHPSGGDVLCYADLARKLQVPNPVIGLADPGLAGRAGPESIAEMVRRYRDVVRAWQPEGPYYLGGWSMGGTVGHELARALREDGAEVGLLVMIDSNSPERIVALEGLDEERTEDEMRLRYLRSLEAFLELDCGTGRGADELEALLADRGVTTTPVRLEVFGRHLNALGVHEAAALDDEVPVLLLRAGRPSPRNARIGMGVDDSFDDPGLGWAEHVHGDFRVVEVDAHHYSVLADPAIKHVADEIAAALRRTGGAA